MNRLPYSVDRDALSHNPLARRSYGTRLTLTLAVLIVTGSPSWVNAQFTFPTASGSSPNATATPASVPSSSVPSSSIAQMFGEAESSIAAGQFTKAVNTYRKLRVVTQSDPTQQANLASLKAELVRRGIDSALLDLPPQANVAANRPQPLAGANPTFQPVPGSQPNPAATLDLATRKQRSKQFTAMGRVALDRGDVSTAYQYATAATNLGVKQNEFDPGDPRPWQLMLDIQAVARRSGKPLNPSGVMQASGTQPYSNGTAPIQQAGGSTWPTNGPQPIVQVQATGTADGLDFTELEDAPKLADGKTLYREGMEALSAGEQVKAREKFVEAWKYESTLDLETRRNLQDKLTLLQPSRLPMPQKAVEKMSPIQKADFEAQQAVSRLYREVTAELAKANEKKESAPLDAQDDLERLARKVAGANIDEASKASLTAMVGRAVAEQTSYVEANRAKIELDLQNEAIRTEMQTETAREVRIDDEISELVETFNDLMDDRRYHEAEVVAKQVGELKPESPIATSMFHSSRMGVRLLMNEEIAADKEDNFVRQMLDVDRTSTPIDPDRPFSFQDSQTWRDLSERRLATGDNDSRLSPREQEIKRKLMTEVEVKYTDRPLGEVLNDLSAVTGIPIVIDNQALAAVQVDRDTPITQNITSRLPLQSALNILLGDMDLTFVLDNDVLNVTSREARRTMTQTKTYRVADLVTPIPNFISGYEQGLSGALKAAYQMINPTTDVQVVPVSMTDIGGGMANSNNANMGRNMLGQYNPMGSGGGFASGGLGASGALQGGRGGGSLADFDSLMTLIQQTIEPDTWEALGGVGTMAPYPQNLSLVISTTSDVHDQIVDLLESLRRLQNLQITIEVRFITLADNFFEQIGLDFDIRFDDNVSSIPADDSGGAVTIGLDAPGTPTADLDIRFDQNTVGAALPPFGGDVGAISTIGFAILSDIEAFFFLQAAQGDNRSNIMQAPKVTLFDGQIASINDTVQRPFVTSIVPVVGDFAVAQQPVIVVLDEGTKLNVQGVVSDDKRFVRLTLVPTFSQIGEVNTFTFEGSRTTNRTSRDEEDTNGDGVIDEEDETAESDVIQGTTVQQPTFASTSVSTTVSVPDGGTILLGGIKRLSEGRNERGVPFLSKIPYVSRLFKNVGVGRTSTSLMLMVTPRIIIQEEEEIAQTGFDPGR